MNITIQKSKTLKPPNIQDIEQTRLFILGYFDGDGGLCLRKDKMSISISGTELFLSWIDKVISEQLKISSGKIRAKRNIHELEYHSKKDVKLIMEWLYTNTEFSLKRKRDRYFQNINLLEYRRNNATVSYLSSK